jgi:maltose O-acetyltransferase
MRPLETLANGLSILRARWYFRSAASLGPRVRLWGQPLVRNNGGQIVIGEGAVLYSTAATLELVADGGRLEIGPRALINYGCSIAATQLVRIGPDCLIGKQCILIDNDFHRLEPGRRRERPPSAPLILEEHVWLGSRVIVLPGVTIGADSVIGAGSVVTRDVPPRCLAAGSPARVIRRL